MFTARHFVFAALIGLSVPAAAVQKVRVNDAQETELKKADHWEEVFDYGRSQEIYQGLLARDDHRSRRTTAYFWERLAAAEMMDGRETEALHSISQALKVDPQNPFARQLRQILIRQRDWPSGRPAPRHYLAARGVGSAGRLLATNGLLHIFVRGRNTEPWTDFEITQVKLAIDQGTEWINGRSNAMDIQPRPTFEHRFLTLPEEPFWRKIDVPQAHESRDFRKSWMTEVLKRFNADSYRDLFNREFAGQLFRNRAVVFHANLKSRAFAMLTCVPSADDDLETAFVYFPVSQIINPMHAVVYSHELMHLYGADDLYNKADDPAAADQEIMKFGSYRLERCSLCPITQFAVGWNDVMPHTSVLVIDAIPIPPKEFSQ